MKSEGISYTKCHCSTGGSQELIRLTDELIKHNELLLASVKKLRAENAELKIKLAMKSWAMLAKCEVWRGMGADHPQGKRIEIY